MRVKLDRVKVEEYEAELLEACPDCGELTVDNSVTEVQFVSSSQECSLYQGLEEGRPKFDDYSSSELFYECHYVTDYECSCCGASITRPVGQEKAK